MKQKSIIRELQQTVKKAPTIDRMLEALEQITLLTGLLYPPDVAAMLHVIVPKYLKADHCRQLAARLRQIADALSPIDNDGHDRHIHH